MPTCIAHARRLEILKHDLLLGGGRLLLPREVLAVVVVLLEVRYVERIVDVGYPRRLDLLLHELREIHLLEEGVILDVAVSSRETSCVWHDIRRKTTTSTIFGAKQIGMHEEVRDGYASVGVGGGKAR